MVKNPNSIEANHAVGCFTIVAKNLNFGLLRTNPNPWIHKGLEYYHFKIITLPTYYR